MKSDRKHLALIAEGALLDYRELEERIVTAAGRLAALGIGAGNRVGLFSIPSVDFVVLAHAVPRVGAILVPLNVRLTKREIELQVEAAGLDLLLVEENRCSVSSSVRILPLGEFRELKIGRSLSAGLLEPDRPAAILFSSGTTGRPRSVLLSWANLMESARATATVLRLSTEDRWLAVLPLFHVGGLSILYRCATVGSAVVLHERFDAARVDSAIDEDRVTLASFVPVMFRRLLAERGDEPLPPHLRAILLGGGPIPSHLIDRSEAVVATYGMTETASAVTLVRPGSPIPERRSAGRPLPGVSIRILDEAGCALPPGATGKISVRGPNVMLGYLGEPNTTASVLRDGWLETGDIGKVDATGSLHVIGRADERIISGGETIDPAEIETAILDEPGILEAVVVPIPDRQWGERPLAFVLAIRPQPTTQALLDRLRRRIAAYKLPQVVWVDEIPTLANGKPDRTAILRDYQVDTSPGSD